MTTAPARAATQVIATPAEVDRTTTWWPRLLKSPLSDQAERDAVAANVVAFSQPADTTRLLARIAALLTPYYTGDVPNGVRMIEAEDWEAAMCEYPEWAISKACRWWKGEDNPRRRQKPLEGDIAARCRQEMGVVRLAEMAIRQFDQGIEPFTAPKAVQPFDARDREAISAEMAAKFPGLIKQMPKVSA